MANVLQPMLFGLLKPKNNIQKIWMVFGILSLVTIIEVIFGIIKPPFMIKTMFISMKLLNWFFIILTIYKAYLITWAFMHMDGEHKWLRRSVVWTFVFFALYMSFIFLTEGDYVFETLKSSFITRDF